MNTTEGKNSSVHASLSKINSYQMNMSERTRRSEEGRRSTSRNDKVSRGRKPSTTLDVRLSPLLIIVVFSIILSSVLSPVESAHVRINDNGGYEDIVVSIGKEVPPIACQQLIQNIQVWTLSSSLSPFFYPFAYLSLSSSSSFTSDGGDALLLSFGLQ
jgi:hypothetical protein